MPRALSDQEIADFRSRLCKAASQLFVKNGVKGFTMRELASALNVSAMTPYRYFRNKSELLATIRAQAFEHFADTLEAARDTETDRIRQVRTLCIAYVHYAVEHPDNYRLMFNFPQEQEDFIPFLKAAMDRCRTWLTSFARETVSMGEIEGDPVKIVHLFWSMLHGAASLYLTENLEGRTELESVVENAIRLLLSCYASRKEAAA